MDKIYSFIPKKAFILAIVLLGMILISIFVLVARQPNRPTSSPAPVISQTPTTQFPQQKTIIGKTTATDLEKDQKITSKKALPNGDTQYSINSSIETRPNQVVVGENKAKFERIVVIGREAGPIPLKISEQIIKFGPAERVVKGSKFYGFHMDTYIYANKGFAFVANTQTDEIYEIQTFTPTSVDKYLSSFEEDIAENKGIKEGI